VDGRVSRSWFNRNALPNRIRAIRSIFSIQARISAPVAQPAFAVQVAWRGSVVRRRCPLESGNG